MARGVFSTIKTVYISFMAGAENVDACGLSSRPRNPVFFMFYLHIGASRVHFAQLVSQFHIFLSSSPD